MRVTLTRMSPYTAYEKLRKLLWGIETENPDAFSKVFYQTEVDVPRELTVGQTIGDIETTLNLPLNTSKMKINFLSPARHPGYNAGSVPRHRLLPCGLETLVVPPNYTAVYEQARQNNASSEEGSSRHMVLTGTPGIGTSHHPVSII